MRLRILQRKEAKQGDEGDGGPIERGLRRETRSTWHRCRTTMRPTSAILDDRRVQFTCESRASRPTRPLPRPPSYPRVVLFDVNKIPGARRKSWPGPDDPQ